MGYRLLADGVAGLHFAYLAYLVVGGFIAWQWRPTIALHAMAVAWGVLVIAARLPCPLTAAQNALRERGGEPRLSDGFIDLYIRGTFYPSAYEAQTRAVLAGIVAASWLGFVLYRRRITRA